MSVLLYHLVVCYELFHKANMPKSLDNNYSPPSPYLVLKEIKKNRKGVNINSFIPLTFEAQHMTKETQQIHL